MRNKAAYKVIKRALIHTHWVRISQTGINEINVYIMPRNDHKEMRFDSKKKAMRFLDKHNPQQKMEHFPQQKMEHFPQQKMEHFPHKIDTPEI